MAAKNDTAAAPHMVAVGSPEFDAAVAAAVAKTAGLSIPTGAGSLLAAPSQEDVPPTSIDLTRPGLDDLTVQFRRFCTFQGCGYQRDSWAGFPRKAAEELERSGVAFIVHDPRRHR